MYVEKYQKHLEWVQKYRKREVSFGGDQGPEGAVVPYMEVRITYTLICICVISRKDYKNV